MRITETMSIFRFLRQPEQGPTPVQAAEPASASTIEPGAVPAEFRLGGRQESINGFFDDVSHLLAVFERMRGELEDKQQQLRHEFEERARERGEFKALSAAYEAARHQVIDQMERIEALATKVSRLEQERDENATAYSLASDQLEAARVQAETLSQQLVKTSLELERAQQFADRALDSLQTVERERDLLSKQAAESEDRSRALEAGLQEKAQSLLSVESERSALRKFCDELRQQSTKLASRVAELEDANSQQAGLVVALEERIRSLQATGSRLSLEHEELLARSQAEAAQASMRVDAATTKLRRLEQENLKLQQQAQASNSESRAAARRMADAELELQRLAERLAGQEAEADSLRKAINASETARAAAIERAEQLSSAHERRRIEAERLETRCASLLGQLERQEAAGHIAHREADEREVQLRDMIERLRGENAVLNGALEEVRKERQRLASELQASWQVKVGKSGVPLDISAILRDAQAASDNVNKIIP